MGNGWTTESGVKIPLDEVAVGDKIMFRLALRRPGFLVTSACLECAR